MIVHWDVLECDAALLSVCLSDQSRYPKGEFTLRTTSYDVGCAGTTTLYDVVRTKVRRNRACLDFCVSRRTTSYDVVRGRTTTYDVVRSVNAP